MKKSTRIIITSVLGIGLIFIGFYLSIFFLFSGRSIYVLPWMITTFVFIVFMVGRLVRQRKNKILNIATLCCFCGFIAIVLVKEIPKIYANYVGKVEAEIDLRAYQPFRIDTKAVHLNEASELKLSENLPRLDGATALYPVYSAFAQAVYPEKKYYYRNSVVRCSKTGKAYENLLNNEVDIIFAAQPSKEHRAAAKNLGVSLNLVPIGYEAFVFFVNQANPTDNLTIDQIKDIYSGKTKNWKNISGEGGKIIVFQRPPNSGSQTMLERIMGDVPIIEPREEDVVDGMGGIISKTAEYTNYKNAIGYSFLFYTTQMVANEKIRILKIEGIAPNRETIINKSYPFSGAFYAITTEKSRSKPNIERLINWIVSPQGQKIIENTGYIPL